ncbi:MAG: response regulator transcription factor [Bacteroidetes bacterium]|nr:response regulator transcription factor [Bacteroidota bacterium]
MRLLIADDHPIFRAGLKEILLSSFDKLQLTECKNGAEAIDAIRSGKPSIAILDINMPELNGLEVAKLVMKEKLATRVIILTMYRDTEMIKKAMNSGAYGYILKDFAANEIIDCIEEVKQNKKYIGPELQRIYKEIEHQDNKKDELSQLLKSLSQAEIKTLNWSVKTSRLAKLRSCFFYQKRPLRITAPRSVRN